MAKSCKFATKKLAKSCKKASLQPLNQLVMLRRKISSKIEAWHRQEKKKALLLTGARQVGKTTSVRTFAQQNYSHFVEINFVKNP
ncbi:MAG: AAA family ATPase, partial [Muribaculaceae bacterium]|nr:AAA family ATPase [Muribaculaceae bacterium]